jgi:hypothetical protein
LLIQNFFPHQPSLERAGCRAEARRAKAGPYVGVLDRIRGLWKMRVALMLVK